VLFFNQMEQQWFQYSFVPLFHYSPPPADERSELRSLDLSFFSGQVPEN